VLVVLGLTFLAAAMGLAFLVETPFLLAFGWVLFVRDAFGRVTVSWPGVVTGVLAAALLCVGAQLFLRRFWRALREDPSVAWPWRWTLTGVSLLALLFVAGIGMVGAVHQTTWLLRADEPLTFSSWRHWQHERTASNLCEKLWKDLPADTPDELRPEHDPVYIVLERTDGAVGRQLLLVPRDPMRREDGTYRCSHGQASYLRAGAAEEIARFTHPAPPEDEPAAPAGGSDAGSAAAPGDGGR
jgi:hypothetical protein